MYNAQGNVYLTNVGGRYSVFLKQKHGKQCYLYLLMESSVEHEEGWDSIKNWRSSVRLHQRSIKIRSHTLVTVFTQFSFAVLI